MKVTLHISYSVDIEVDDRASMSDVTYQAEDAFTFDDGRMPFASEMIERGVYDTVESVGLSIQRNVGYDIARKYPGTCYREYVIADKMPPPKVGRLNRKIWAQPHQKDTE